MLTRKSCHIKFLNSPNSVILDRKDFQALLIHFRTVNESFPPGKSPSEALKNCARFCEALLVDQSRPSKKSGSSKLKSLNWLLLVILVSLVWYDIRVHGHGRFDQSRIGMAMERHGVTDQVSQLYERARPYLDRARPYLDQARPYLDQAQEKVLLLR